MWLRLTAFCLVGFTTTIATASQSFTNRTSFLVALGSPATQYGFDDQTPGTIFGTQLAGVNFQGSGTVESSASAHTPSNVLATTASPIDFVFDAPIRGVGFHNTSGVDEVVTYAGPNGGGTIFQALIPPGGFLGFVSDQPIGLGTIGWIGPPGSHFSIDSFVFRPISTTPVPALEWPALVGLAGALLAIHGLGRRRRKTA